MAVNLAEFGTPLDLSDQGTPLDDALDFSSAGSVLDFSDAGQPIGGEAPGRLRTAASSLARGFGQTFAGFPKSLAMIGVPDPAVWRNFERIDKGEGYLSQPQHLAAGAGALVASDPFESLYQNYESATAEERQQLRQSFIDDAEKAQKSSLYQAGDKIDQFFTENFPVNPELQDEFWTSKVPQGLGSGGAFVTASIIGRGVFRGSALGIYGVPAVLGSAVNRVDQFEQALDSGADIATALEASNIGSLIGLTEAVPIGNLLTRLDRVSGGSIKRYLVRAAVQGTEEAVQETFAGIMNEAVAQNFYDPERGIWTAERLEEGAVGFTTGAILETLFTLALPGRRRGAGAGGVETGETSTIEEVEAFRKELLQELDAQPERTEAESNERDFLLDNSSNPEVIAAAYGVQLALTGEVEKARVETEPLSQEDIDSPIPNELIEEGHAIVRESLGEQGAAKILEAAGFPAIGSEIALRTRGGEQITGTVVDAFDQDGQQGAKIKHSDGRVIAESFEALRGRIISTQEQTDAEETQEAETTTPAVAEVLTPTLDTEGLTPVEAPLKPEVIEQVAPLALEAESEEVTGGTYRARKRSDAAFRAFDKALNAPHPTSSSALNGLQGWIDAEAGRQMDETRVTTPSEDMRPGGFNPVDSYRSAYVSQQRGEPIVLRTLDETPAGVVAVPIEEEASAATEPPELRRAKKRRDVLQAVLACVKS